MSAAGGTAGAPLPRGLRWSSDDEPGVRRRRAGRNFRYLDHRGRSVAAAGRDRIRALAIPPAWTDVWICADADGHLQATGRDAKGRKQYRYHPGYRAHREATKFDRLADVAAALPAVRRRVAADLRRSGMPREKVLATIVRLLEATLVRVGNEEYARDNGSFGLTTLRARHARCTPAGTRLVFRGKHGVAANVTVTDARLRRIVQRCQDLPGQLLFQYLDDDGTARPLSSTDVNEYLREVTGIELTAKDFRTWMGTLLAASALAELPPPRSAAEAARTLARVIEVVAANLGNTPTVCRASYVHPAVIELYGRGDLPEQWSRAPARGSRSLIEEERKLLALLRESRSARPGSRSARPGSRSARPGSRSARRSLAA